MSEEINHDRRRFVTAAAMTITVAHFGMYSHRLISSGIGHNLPQEAAQALAQAIVDVDRY